MSNPSRLIKKILISATHGQFMSGEPFQLIGNQEFFYYRKESWLFRFNCGEKIEGSTIQAMIDSEDEDEALVFVTNGFHQILKYRLIFRK